MKIKPLATTYEVGAAFLKAFKREMKTTKPKRGEVIRKLCRCGRPAIKVSQHEGVCAFCAGTEKRGVGRKFSDIDVARNRRLVV